MATEVAKLRAVLEMDDRDFKRGMSQGQTSMQRFGGLAKSALIGGAAAGLYAVGKAAKIGWDEFNQGQAVAAQTAAVLKSTGGIANVTASHVESLGESLMRISGVDDELIKSGENVLLTFRKIRNEAGQGNDVFDQATKLTLDLSVAMGKDLNSSAVMVGKALNDPLRGLTSLTRVGVQFSDQQRKVIERLVESGKTMQAQKMILAELRKEFGGSAKAAGETFGGQINILRERMNNFLGDLVGKAIPYLQRFATKVIPILNTWLERAGEFVETFREGWVRLGRILERHQDTLAVLRAALGRVATAIGALIKFNITLYATYIRVWLRIVDVTLSATDKIIGAVRAVGSAVRAAAGFVSAAADRIRSAFMSVLGVVMSVVHAIQTLINWIRQIPSTIHLSLPDPTPGFDIPGIPGFAKGGIVPGPIGRPLLATVHGGERITPPGRSGDRVVNVYLRNDGVLGSQREVVRWLNHAFANWQRNGGKLEF